MTTDARKNRHSARLRLGVSYLEALAAAAMLVVMVSCTVLQVVARFVFNTGLSWTDEMAMFSFIWAALMGAALVINTGGAHRILSFISLLPTTLRRVVLTIVYIVILAALVLLIIYGLKLLGVVHFQKSPILKLNMSFIYAALPVSAGLMLVSMFMEWRTYLMDSAGAETDG